MKTDEDEEEEQEDDDEEPSPGISSSDVIQMADKIETYLHNLKGVDHIHVLNIQAIRRVVLGKNYENKQIDTRTMFRSSDKNNNKN
jgi:hypothetical protein